MDPRALQRQEYGKALQQQIEENRRRKESLNRKERQGSRNLIRRESQDDTRLPDVGVGGNNRLQPIAPDGNGGGRGDKKKRPSSDQRRRERRGNASDPSLQGPDGDEGSGGHGSRSSRDKEMDKMRSQIQWMMKHSQFIEDRFTSSSQ